MFFHTKQYQYNATPEGPDQLFAKKLQEDIGGQWSEISVMIGSLFQGWNCSEGEESRQGRWASGRSKDGKGEFEYLDDSRPMSREDGELSEVDPRLHGTPKEPKLPSAS